MKNKAFEWFGGIVLLLCGGLLIYGYLAFDDRAGEIQKEHHFLSKDLRDGFFADFCGAFQGQPIELPAFCTSSIIISGDSGRELRMDNPIPESMLDRLNIEKIMGHYAGHDFLAESFTNYSDKKQQVEMLKAELEDDLDRLKLLMKGGFVLYAALFIVLAKLAGVGKSRKSPAPVPA